MVPESIASEPESAGVSTGVMIGAFSGVVVIVMIVAAVGVLLIWR